VRPSHRLVFALVLAVASAIVPAHSYAQAAPPDSRDSSVSGVSNARTKPAAAGAARSTPAGVVVPDSTGGVRRVGLPRLAADTDTTKTTTPPATDLQFHFNLRGGVTSTRFKRLNCTSLEAFQVATQAACQGSFLTRPSDPAAALTAAGRIGLLHVNVDYDQEREFDASQTLSLYYEGDSSSTLRRVDVGNISFVPPSTRFLTSSLPSGNYGAQITAQLGRVQLKSIFAKQTGNVARNRRYDFSQRSAQQHNQHETADYQIERLRFFWTVDPALFRGVYPNIDILNSSQLRQLRAELPDTLRPSRVLVYRLQFGAQPQDVNGPRFKLHGAETQGTQTYDLLREGVDYFMDQSLLWFALVRPLNETNERLVVAYNVRLNGRDTVWTTTGGTPDLQRVINRDQFANLVTDPNVGPSSPAFRNEIRSVYRIGGEDVVRQSVKLRIVAGSGLLEHPLAGPDATFLQMFGLAQPTAPTEFDYQNRLWPRLGDPAFDLGIGAPDIRHAQSLIAAQVIKDYFLVFPSLQPFSARNSGLVFPGNPTNDQIYTLPVDYLDSPQHPPTTYRIDVEYEAQGVDESGTITLGATQMRPGSERLVMDGRTMVRDLDYRIDYDLGRIEFTRPDTLFQLPRHLDVSYEENPTFAGAPTTLGGFVAELPLPHGTLNFAAINQSQGNAGFTRPALGFQGNSTLTAGVSGQFSWDLPQLTNFASRFPFGPTKAPSHFSVQAELAGSRPQFIGLGDQRAYVETFDADGGIGIPIADDAWENSSLPAYGNALRARFGGTFFEPTNDATLVWQTNVQNRSGKRITFTLGDIDPLAVFTGAGAPPPEPMMWLTLLPLDSVGRFNASASRYQWTDPGATANRRFHSIRATLSPSGIDLTRGEHLEFWTLVDTNPATLTRNGTVIFDFGDVSENTVAFVPKTLTVQRNGATTDSLFTGKRLVRFDTLDTERDTLTHVFNAGVNDVGLPGDLVDSLTVIDNGAPKIVKKLPICRALPGAIYTLGDPANNCTVGNNRLDEEDIDLDNEMNFPSALRERERILRYVIDLSDPTNWKRLGGRYTDTLFVNGVPQPRTRRWALISTPFLTPTDSLNDVVRRRIRAVRLTVVSGKGQGPEEQTQLPIADIRITGAPWLNRSNQTLMGIAGVQNHGGFVVTSTIGTNDSTSALVYQPPPGVVNSADTRGAQFASTQTQINESSMRIQAGNMPLYHRAEAFLRFQTGAQNYMTYRQMRVWGRGRGNGWGQNGELQMYVKLGRDENNFYMVRAPMNAGQTQAAWTDLVLDFNRFIDLRRRIQNAFTSGKTQSIACTGVDSAIITASPLPAGAHTFAACDNGYMALTTDPAVAAPNLAAVQELAVGIVRVANSETLSPSDTLELWVDDIRLDHQVNNTGMAGQISLAGNIGDLLDLRYNISNQDANFRQMGEQPTFLGQRTTDVAATVRLEKLLPSGAGFSLPLTVTRIGLGSDPLFLSQSDISGRGIGPVRTPRNDLTTYSLTMRRTKPIGTPLLGPLVNNLDLTSSYLTGVDRTEFQNGSSHNFSVALDYLVTADSARTADLPEWMTGALGALPQALQAGPISTLRGTHFRWNPTQLRFTSSLVRGDDRRVSFLNPTSDAADAPAESRASSRLWRNGSVLELHPTTSLTARWEASSVRDFRDYRDTLVDFGALGQRPLQVAPGFERERSIFTNFSFAPLFSAWFRPRADFGTQYGMLRDPNVRSFSALPGVIGVDSVLAEHDSLTMLHLLAIPRRLTAAQTSSIGTTIDVARAIVTYSADSASMARRVGKLFAPLDVSYTRSLLTALDGANAAPPLGLQFGLAGPGAYRRVNGEDATTAGQTGSLAASNALQLPFGTSFVNRYLRTTTLNWIERPDSTQAHVDGSMTTFPDETFRWGYRPPVPTLSISSFDANVGYAHSLATVSLPSLLFSDTPPEIRRTHSDVIPLGASIAWSGRAAPSLGARYSILKRIDSLPGSVAHTHGNEISIDAGRAFHVPESLGLGLKSDLRTRLNYSQAHNITTIADSVGATQARLQDNGRQAFNFTADVAAMDNATFTLQASHVITFDKNLNTRTAQTIFTALVQFQVFGTGK